MREPRTQMTARHRPSEQAVWSEKKVRRILQELDQSGETVTHFARRHGWTPQRLYWWMSKLGWKRTRPVAGEPMAAVQPEPKVPAPKPAAPLVAGPKPVSAKAVGSVSPVPKSTPGFLPVHVVADPSARTTVGPSGVVIELGSGCCIRVEPCFDAQVLRQVVQALMGALSC